MKRLTTRNAHLEGFCSMQFAPGIKDRKLVTCGSDCLVKIHDLEKYGDDGNDVEEIDHFHGPVHVVAVSPNGQSVAAGGEESLVAMFKMEDADFERNVTRCSLPIRDLSFSQDSSYLAIASDDSEIKIVNVNNVEDCKTLQGHEGGVKSVCFDPKNEFLLSAGSDRSVRVWDVVNGTEKHKIAQVLEKDAATSIKDGVPANLCRVAWSPDGTIFAVAGSRDIKIFERDGWKESESCVGGHLQNVTDLAFSSNGLYLLSVDTSGVIVIWDVSSRESIKRFPILTARWDPFSNSIALISVEGTYGLADSVVPTDKIGPNDRVDSDQVDADSVGELDEDELEIDPANPSVYKQSNMQAVSFSRPNPQAPFQPQSTPVELKRRFLTYTTVGHITSRNESTYNAIEIEFADINTHRPIRFNDFTGFTMAAMDASGAVFASPQVKERNGELNLSTLSYRPFDSWASQSDWTTTMPENEEIMAVATSESWIAAATSKRILRIFSTSCVQLMTVMYPGPALCMHGCNDFLCFIHHTPSSPSLSGDQELQFLLMNVSTKTTVARGPVCLSPGSKLEWLQVTETGMVAVMDSEGMVMVYSHAEFSGQWVPMLDIKTCNKHQRDWFWPIRITDSNLLGIVCKIEKRYPDVPQPVLVKHDLKMPILPGHELEEQWLRGSIFVNFQATQSGGNDDNDIDVMKLELDKKLIQLINSACEQRKLAKALDLAKQISSEKALEAAITLANRHRLPNLAEIMDEYRQIRFQELEVEEEEEVTMQLEEGLPEEQSEPTSPSREQNEDEADEVQNEPRGFVDPSPSSRSKAETPTGRPANKNKSNLSNLFSVKNKLINKTDSVPKGNFMEKINAIKKSSSAGRPKNVPAMPFGVSRLGKSKAGK
eukprot:768724-Hanusia_phi.AAC.7